MAKKKVLFTIIALILLISAVLAALFWLQGFSGKNSVPMSAVNRELVSRLHLTETRQSSGVMVGRLHSAAQIDGFECAAGWVHFYDSGRLKAFNLGESLMIQGNQIPAGTWVTLNPDATLSGCFFPEDTKVQGYVCKGGKLGAEGAVTGFYPTGHLSFFNPRDDMEIEGVLCRATPFGGVYLHDSSRLKQCILARDEVINGRAVQSGEIVVLDEKGDVQSVSSPLWIERIRNWIDKFI